MGKRGPKPKGTPAAQPTIKPQGKEQKRTPTSAFDPAAGRDVYEPEKVVAARLCRGTRQWLVKWTGYEAKHNTWEPLENLAGCEDLIADFNEREKTRIAQLEAAAEATRNEKQDAAAKAAADAAAEAAAVRVAAQSAASNESPAAASSKVDKVQEKVQEKVQHTRRTHWVKWQKQTVSKLVVNYMLIGRNNFKTGSYVNT